MQLAYCLYSCNSDGNVSGSLVITPDGTKVIYSEHVAIKLPYEKIVSLEVQSKREVMGILAKLLALGLEVISYKDAVQVWHSQRCLLGCDNQGSSLIIGFKYGKADRYLVVDLSKKQFGYVSVVNHFTVALVVNVKRKRELDSLDWTLKRGYGFKGFEVN